MATERLLGRYRLERVLGTGTFATVWLAHDEQLDRQVAIKLLADNWSQDLDVRRRFLTEAGVLLSAESPRITRGFELGESDEGRPYLVMTLADRGTLDDRLRSKRRTLALFTVPETATIVREIALALDDVHELGHLHRDVKPSNVLIRSGGDGTITGLEPGEQLLIGDFGLARGIDASAITLVVGSPGYVAPEQAAGLVQLDRRSDLYPLGRIALELLTGDPGGRATTMSGAADERVEAREVLAEHRIAAPPELVTLIDQLLAVEPDDRPATASEVARALTPFTDPHALQVSVVPDVGGERRDPGRRSLARRFGFAALAVVIAVTAAAVVLISRRTDGDGAGDSGTTLSTLGSEALGEAATTATLPLPERASIQEGSDSTRTKAVVSAGTDDVVAHFSTPPASWEVVDGPTEQGDAIAMTLTNGARDASVTISETAQSADPLGGRGISEIVIQYDP